MFRSLFKMVPLLRCSIIEPHTQFFCLSQLNFLSTSPRRCSKSLKKHGDEHSYTVNYLINTLGISSERAIKSCKYITLQGPEKPDIVISFLQKHGFSKTQISKMVGSFPTLIVFDPEKNLLPKIEFFLSLGFSMTDVASILTLTPQLFSRSLEKQLMPSVRFLSVFLPVKEEMLAALKSYGDILGRNLEASLIPNIQYLKQLGVPQSNISRILQKHPIIVIRNHNVFRTIVDDINEMGLNPKNYTYLRAICLIVSMSKATWEKKVQLYKSWGFTQVEIIQTFRIHPNFMAHSPQKIMDMMDYLVNKMGFKNSIVIEQPLLLIFSLQKRIIPRCSVYKILSDKNLFPLKYNVKQLLTIEEKKFLKKFVEPFEKQVPGLLMLYKKDQSGSKNSSKPDKMMCTLNYLTTTFKFSPERAIALSKRIAFDMPEQPDSVTSFLYINGLTKTQIYNMVKRYPHLLLCDTEKILFPKIEFFKSLGLSKADVASIVFAAPRILHTSLENQLMPSVRFLKRLFESDDAVLLACLKCYDNRILCVDLETTLIPNIDYLKESGVPQSNIMQMLKTQSRTLTQDHDRFRKIVENVKKMRLNPEKFVFLLAIYAFISMSKEKWENKMQVYIHWGFSEDEILETFRKHPHIMIHSTDKVTGLMHYLVDEMGFKSSLVIERPQLLCLSLQKRIIPRCSLYRIMSGKNLVPENSSIKQFLETPEKKFISKFVVPFETQVPELLNLYTKYLNDPSSERFR